MTRCDYDVVFYRVFCITLLGIAFTFTVILTNVFIDIDGLLANKQGKHKTVVASPIDGILDEFTPEPLNIDDASYGDIDDSYRTKRSIETQNILFRVKNSKLKNILTNRLETLLEALETEESLQNAKTEEPRTEATEEPTTEVTVAEENKIQEEKNKKQKDEDMLHLTMHNVLLQGIIGHMNLKEVYKRVNSMMNNLNKGRKDQKVNEQSKEAKSNPKLSISDRYVEELIRGNILQDQILNSAFKKLTKEPEEMSTPSTIEPEKAEHTGADIAINTKLGPKLFIKTTIDIKSIANEPNDTISNGNIHGMIDLIYNGKSMRLTNSDADQTSSRKYIALDMTQLKPITTKVNTIPMEATSQVIPVDIEILKEIPSNYIKRFVAEYFKHFPTTNKQSTEEMKERIETKRLKRHVKIKFNKEKKPQYFQEAKPTVKKETEDDELYVEIETHFDSKGMKGEKKKKLIRSLIDKIQKAIRSEETKKNNHDSKKLKHKPLHIRKRLQNPLEHVNLMLESKDMVPISSIVHRQLYPIVVPRTLPSDDTSAPKVRDRSGEAWRKEFVGPTFLTATKSINSAEMSEVEVDYNKVLDVNGIPQRLQKPLNTDTKNEKEKPNSYFDLGNMKFFIKDVDGSGFSIGFNQYVDEPPDPETIKLFTGLENVIQTYHQDIDQIQDPQLENLDRRDVPEVIPMKNDHIIVRRSVNHKHDYHTNEYKIIYDGNFLPYNDYKDIYTRENSKTKMAYSSNQYQGSPLIVDENIFDKNLKPAEIFGLANLFQRKKRSLKVKKISNLKSKMKLNRYINTKAMSSKKIFLNKRGNRHKRQISKIRIIASDLPYKQSNDAELFLVSGENENVFADRAVVKDVEGTEVDGEKMDVSEYSPDQTVESISPYRIFESKYRKNNLMSKYPHIFLEEDMSRSKEDLSPAHNLLYSKLPTYRRQSFPIDDAESEIVEEDFLSDTSSTILPEIFATTKKPGDIHGVEDIVNALQSKAKYKVSLKVTPKNISTDLNPGFKEIHTSINKRYNKNGLVYTSLVNVSEISKITNPNKTKVHDPIKEVATRDNYLTKKVKDQHDKMQAILKQHQKHIDEQLAKLREEKTHIESILVDENNTDIPHFDYIDVVMPSNPDKVLHMSKDEVKRLAGIILNNSITTSTEAITEKTTTVTKTTTAPTTTTQITTTQITTTQTESPTTKPTTQRPFTVASTHLSPTYLFNEHMKKNLLHTIERNEKLTDQILRKIDINTELLQAFLRKFTGPVEPHKVERIANIETKEVTTDKLIPKFEHNNHPFPIDWRQHGNIPYTTNLIQRNGSQIAIPFLYAYQHPIMPSKMNSPMASVLYHGTLHTNPVPPKNLSSEKHKFLPMPKRMNVNQTQTHFFIDETESDYKVIPVNEIEKRQMLNKNMTKT